MRERLAEIDEGRLLVLKGRKRQRRQQRCEGDGWDKGQDNGAAHDETSPNSLRYSPPRVDGACRRIVSRRRLWRQPPQIDPRPEADYLLGPLTMTNRNAQNWNGDFTFTGTSDLKFTAGDAAATPQVVNKAVAA